MYNSVWRYERKERTSSILLLISVFCLVLALCVPMFHMNTHTDTREPRCASEKLAICCHCQLPSSTKLKRTGCYIPSNGFCLSFFLYIGKKRNKVLSTFFSFVCHKAAIIQVPCTYRGQQKGIVLQRQQN